MLADWADRITTRFEAAERVYAYTNNDPGGAAVRDAGVLVRLLRERGRVAPAGGTG